MNPLTRTGLPIGVAACVLALAACGGNGAANTAATTGPTQSSTSGAQQGQRQARIPGTSGLVAEVDGSTLQVQGSGTQTAVTWTSATRFTQEVAAQAADLKVGTCVMVRSAQASGTAPTTPPTTVTATSVAITTPVNGQCTGGFGRGAGLGGGPGGGTGAPGQGRPTGIPTDRPTGQGRGGFGGFGGAFGKVVAVTSDGFTVQSETFARAGSTATTAPTTRTVAVSTSPTTTYTRTVAATAAAARVGSCVTALGTTDQVGAVSARSIAVRPAVNGMCTQGFGPRAGGAGGGTATTNG